MAVRFAERHRNDYVAIFWINGMDEARISDSFLTISRVLGLDSGAGSPEAVLTRTRTWLSTHSEWLLIIDNLDDDAAMDVIQRKYVNAGMNGDVLITSRNGRAVTQWDSIEVSDMEPNEATALLRNITGLGMAEEAELVALSEDLGHLPLALDQAASFIRRTGKSVSQYRKFFAAEKRRLLEHYPSRQYNQECRQNVMTTWEISFDYINQRRPQAAKLLLILSLLHYDDIPEQILESALEGQRHWASNGEFEELPKAERWIPGDLLTMFNDPLRLVEASTALMNFSFLRRQIPSTSFRMHPLVHYWASQRLADSPKLKQQLVICATGLVASSFEQYDRLPPLVSSSYGGRGIDERTLDIWPLRQYPHLALHAHRCLHNMRTINEMPESVAHLVLSLLQVLGYSTLGSLEDDQEVSFSLINCLEQFQTAADLYLRYSIVMWRLTRADLCGCRKHTHLLPDDTSLRSSDIPNAVVCKECSFAYGQAELLLLSQNKVSARTKALRRSLRLRLQCDPCWGFCFRPGGQSDIGPADEMDSGYSSLEMYEAATRQYQVIRSSCELLNNQYESTELCMNIAETFKKLCGLPSEEYRRSLFYATSVTISKAVLGVTISWQEVETMLQPLVKASITNPVHTWSHERCVVRYTESLLKQGKEKEAQDVMKELQEAYRATGKQLRSVESSALLKARSGVENVSLGE